MGVPPFNDRVYGEDDQTGGRASSKMGIGFVKYTLQRHLVKFEQEINRKVFRTARNFCEFNTAGLERGDTMQRFNAYRIALGRAGEQPWMDVNEIRKLENWEPRDDLVAVGTPSNNPESEPEKKPEGEDANEPAAAPTE